MKFSFITRRKFNELSINIVGYSLYIFNTYLAKENTYSSNILYGETILYNGFRFIIKMMI